MNAPLTSTALADGLYFGLPEPLYRADPAIGSTDMKRLAADPAGYWWGSVLNPSREPEEDTPAKLFGRAVHKVVLEGDDAFDALYGEVQHSGVTKEGKAERAALAAAGKTALKTDAFGRALLCGDAVRANPHLATAFDGPTEVSVFWTRDDVRRKARLDCLKIRATSDLKTITPKREEPFRGACIRAISDYRYDIQAAHYHEARQALVGFASDGAVQGDHDPAWLARVQADGAFVFVFLRVDGPPQTCAVTLSPGSLALDAAARDLEAAAEAYRAALAQFGPHTPWITADPPEELDIGALPAWHGRT